MNKTIYLFLLVFLASSNLQATASNPAPRVDPASCLQAIQLKGWPSLLRANNGLEQLNQNMQATLRLNPEQLKAIRKTNRKFWEERQAILKQPGKIAHHTALLASWDRWARQLESILDKYQYKAFLEWQYQVSPLSERPY